VQEYTNAEAFCHSALLLPGTSLVSEASLGVACLIILLYLFLGIAIVADLFMEAIEVITSSKVVVYVMDPTDPGKTIPIEKDFWNPTIANLTLLALGSSMPEILLSIFSTVGDLDGIPSELGPMGIVGSAAFNLLVISGLSVLAVGDTPKKVNDLGVFAITSVASLWAYIWLYLCLEIFSPVRITLVEGWLTLLFFILLIVFAYAADRLNNNVVT
jgi:solute carrier family 8 (sodium/calcium exchanger)